MADVTGARGTGNITQSIRKIDMADTVLELEPSEAPLTVLTSRLNRKSTVNPEYSWIEDQLRTRFTTINNVGGYNTTATALVVTDVTIMAQYDLIKVTRTGELMRVVSVNAGTQTATVVRGVGSGTPGTGATINQGDELLVGGSAQPEGDTSKPARSTNPSKVTNYTQIHRTPYESTETLRHSDTFVSPADWARIARKAGIEHNKSWEYIFWLGKPYEDLTGSQPLRTTGGVLHFIQSNITAVGGTLTEATFWAALRNAFRYGTQGTKTAFCSRLVVDVLQGFPRGKLQVIQSDGAEQTYGLNVRRFVSPHGQLNVVTHNLFEGSTYGGYCAILDMAQIQKRYLSNSEGSRDVHIRQNIQANDADTRKDEYLGECGLQLGLEKSHALLTGITG